jgi:hypothetical protein
MRRSNAFRPKPGYVPTIACINHNKVLRGVDFNKLISALQKYVDKHFAPVWGTPAKLVKATKPRDNAWTMIFTKTVDEIRNLRGKLKKEFGTVEAIEGTHLLKHRPVAFVFVEHVLRGSKPRRNRDKISAAASHELAEMLVDPGNNLWGQHGEGTLYAYEVCDVVEEEFFRVNGLAMSDFVYPAFFEGFHKPNSVQFDHMKKVKHPFEILKGGFTPVRPAGKRHRLTLRSTPKKERELRNEDRELHRSEFRR